MRFPLWPLTAVGVLALSACKEPEEPTFCVLRAADFPEPEKLDRDDCKAEHQRPPRLHDGEGFFVLHLLPEDVAVDEPLTLTFTTPCKSTTIERRHARGSGQDASASRVLFAARAPAGASCSLAIEASILNSSDGIVTSPVGADSCAAVGGSCPDGGTDSGG